MVPHYSTKKSHMFQSNNDREMKIIGHYMWRNFHAPEGATMLSLFKDCGNTYRMTSSWKDCSNIFDKCIDLKKENLKIN